MEQFAYPELKPFDQDWRWCHRYAHDVVSGLIPSGRWMKAACQRHLDDMTRGDIYFDEQAANSIVKWFEYIPITDGPKAGERTILLPWQIFVVCSLIAWKWSEDEFDQDGCQIKFKGLRRYNQAFILVARKGGKSTLCAGLILYLMYKHTFRPRAYSLATKRDQAKEVWDNAKLMIELSPPLQEFFEPRANDILLPSRRGEFKPLASDSNSLDGKNPMVASLDECHAIKDRNLYGVMVSAFGAQPEYLMLTITTAGTILDGICTDLYNNGCSVLSYDNEIIQDNYFYAMFQIDMGDQWDNPKTWYKSNPGLIHGLPSMKYLKDRCLEAQMSTEEKSNFLTKHCNLFVHGAAKWLDMEEVKACRVEGLSISDFAGQVCYIAVDRALVLDVTSVCALFPTPDGGAALFWKNIISKQGFEKASDQLKSVYSKAEAEGDLIISETPVVSDDDAINLIKDVYDLATSAASIGYDPWHMREVCTKLDEQGYPVVAVSQGTGNISEPAKKLEALIKNGLIKYDSRMFEFAASCAVIGVTKMNNVAIYRDKPKNEKIDPLISAIIALSCATLMEPNDNIYEQRGLLML